MTSALRPRRILHRLTRSSSRSPRLLFALPLAGVFLLLAPASPASAHASLVDTAPANDEIVQTAPDEVVLTFNEQVRPVDERVMVVDPAGEPVHAGPPVVDGTDVVIPLGDLTETGTYLVSYRVISADSHPVGGAVTFSLGARSEVPDAPDTVSAATDPVVDAAMSVNKYLGYAGLVLAVGAALMLTRLWPRRLPRTAPARLAWVGLGLIGVSTVAGVVLQAPYTAGGSLTDVTAADLQGVLGSTYGAAHVVRAGVLISVALLLRPLLSGRATRADQLLVAGLAVVGMGTWPFSGHPVGSPIPLVTVTAGTVHVAAAAVWAGGLVMLAAFLLRPADGRELAAILPEWSRWAALSVAALLLVGVLLAVVEVGTPEALIDTAYGRVLLVKVALVALVIAVAAGSRRLVRRQVGHLRVSTMRLLVVIEAVVLAAVLAVSAVLVQTTPGRVDISAPAGTVASDYYTTLDSELYSLQVLLEPGRRGSNTLHLYAYTPAGDPLPVEEWRATAALPAEDIEPIDIALLPLTDTHAFGEVALPFEGDWEFRFTLRLSEFEQASVESTVPIEE